MIAVCEIVSFWEQMLKSTSKYCPDYLEVLRKTTENLNKDS
jgi:hypothetical protein